MVNLDEWEAGALKAGLTFTFSTGLGDIEFLGEVTGLGSFAEITKLSEDMVLFGHTVRVLSVEGLIRSKRASGRRKDLLLIPSLEALREQKKGTGTPED